ncbi:hypothetical protein Poli38472_010655 [Pythium oligandrum]|uniref:Uncharacterized protein n=1 Tax=Pythium oligandrum TaxID=41045 RepID=A0A8K1C3I2_PYTOL|nr:hypothetical protein Poli38472_010655 [Pythium oligandrum]|eukprot:TMW55773.1 hypothetical protein Poli38472_010655 [Pythium oligandrum]
MARPATTAPLVDPAIIEPKRFTDEDIVEAQARCQDRVKVAHTKEAIARRHDREVELDRFSRTKNVSFEASVIAARRLRDRKVHERKLQEEEVDLLMSQQTSSIEAMNIARMLSPRYEEKVAFQPSVSRNSVEEARVKQLLMNARVGSFYQ